MLDLFAVAQGLLGARVFGRMAATAAGDPIAGCPPDTVTYETASIILPVLNEATRIERALAALVAQTPALREVLVVDGGSTDDTREIARRFSERDRRIRLIDAGAAPAGWNGKAWNLACGLAASSPADRWIITLDADVTLRPHAIASLLHFASGAHLDAFSAAPRLALSTATEAMLHPAFLATLVYRFGLPGNVAQTAACVQANGQCFMVRREALVATQAIRLARASRCEDVTIARELVRCGYQVGFFEAGTLATVRMYESAAACFANWPRSLPLRDDSAKPAELALALAELTLVQALPLWCAAIAAARGDTKSLFFRINMVLALARLGVLSGTARAYENPPATFWLAAALDVPAVAAIVRASLMRRAVWRGRELVV